MCLMTCCQAIPVHDLQCSVTADNTATPLQTPASSMFHGSYVLALGSSHGHHGLQL